MQTSQEPYRSGIYPRSLAIYPPAVRMHLIHPLSHVPTLDESINPTKAKKIPTNAKPIQVTKVGDTRYPKPLIFDSISACLRHFNQIPAKGPPGCNLRSTLERWAARLEVDYAFI